MQVNFPIFTAPAGGHVKGHPDGELATAQATGALGTLMIVSAHSSYSLEEIAEAVAAAPDAAVESLTESPKPRGSLRRVARI